MVDVLDNCKKILFLIWISISFAGTKRKFPRIQDVISFSDMQLHVGTFSETIESPTDGYIPRVLKKIKSDIDIESLKINEELLRWQIRGNLENAVVYEKPVETRRVQKYVKGRPDEYKVAINLQFRTKILDCMLQLVYMARHYLKLFERKEYINKNSAAYRIGVIARKLKELYKKSTRILEMLNNRQKKDLWAKRPTSSPALTLHHKVAKMYTDFNYYYEVLKRLHAKIREMKKLPKEKPPLKRFPQKWYDV